MNNLVSEVYSKAFFDLSKDKEKTEDHMKDLSYVGEVLKENPKLRDILNNPNIDKNDKKELLSKIFLDIDGYTKNFLAILVDKSRFSDIDPIIRAYTKQYDGFHNISRGIVYSTESLSEEEIESLRKVLSNKFQKKVELENRIDEELIAGISVKLDGKVIDNSIKARLENLRRSLKNERG